MYVPAGWLHATLNLGETIGAGGQAHWPATARRDLMSSTRVHDAEVHRNFAIANHHLGHSQLALQHVQRALELGKSDDISLKIKLVEELGAAKRGAEAVATALQTLELLEKLVSSAHGSTCSPELAAFYYELASKMASVGVSQEKLHNTFERAFELVQGVRPASVEVSVQQLSVAGELSNSAAVQGEDRQHSGAPGKEESAMACRVALQLATGAAKQQRWHEAARWLREALRVPRALSERHTSTARMMLLEAEVLAAQTVALDEESGRSPRQERSPSPHSNAAKRSRTKPNALKRRRVKP
jgi:tetratricopeptide (TPR) repeat protein